MTLAEGSFFHILLALQSATAKAADHPLFGKPELVKLQRKDGSDLMCRTVLNDVRMGEDESEHLLLYLEECDPATQARMCVARLTVALQ